MPALNWIGQNTSFEKLSLFLLGEPDCTLH
jgi:hypothetical protein